MASRDITRARGVIRISILALGVAASVLWHGFRLYSASVVWEHAALPSAMIGGAFLVVVAKHIGVAGVGYAWLQRRFRAGKHEADHTR